jgi:hypothetical protein
MKTLLNAISLLLILTSTLALSADSDHVARAVVTSMIENREPVDKLNEQAVDSQISKVYFFTEILNKPNSKIVHRWYLNGRLEAEVMLNIGDSSRWRTYSSKNLVPNFHQGNWEIEVLDDQGKVLASEVFTYGG